MRTVQIVLPLRSLADRETARYALSVARATITPAARLTRGAVCGGIETLEIALPWRGFDDAQAALRFLDFCNDQYGPVPDPLHSGATHYEREPEGQEKWCVWVVALAQGFEDCEGLASWLGAFLRWRGQEAAGLIYPAGPGMLHCVTETVGGLRLDPSKALGMGGAA